MWWCGLARATLRAQTDKVYQIFHTVGGWEVWAQIEIAIEVARREEIPSVPPGIIASTVREKMVYANKEEDLRRCDFLQKVDLGPNDPLGDNDPRPHIYFMEMKCLSKGKLSEFITEVRKDIVKVRDAKPLEEWRTSAFATNGVVMPITVNPELDPRVDERMKQLESELDIQWVRVPITDDGRILVWAWGRTFF